MAITQTKQSLITSLNKAINSAKVNGRIDLQVLFLYQLYIYYIDFTEGKEEFIETNKQLKQSISQLKYKYPNIICNYKLKIDTIDNIIEVENTAPVVQDINIDIDGAFNYDFQLSTFVNNYSDVDNNPYNKITIYPNNQDDGYLLYNNVIITSPVEIDLNTINNLKFAPIYPYPNEIINESEVDYTFSYKISDDSPLGDLYSNKADIIITNSNYVVNQPATIGDIAITAENREETILTLNMFTVQMAPPYNDPENDLIDAIRIDSISSTNQGIFYYNNNPIQVNDIITREDLQSNLFKHVGPNIDVLANDSITFSARDEGSQQWVQ